ncbi:hypothetical protein RBH29_14595, partial [Herbivorax sp. ANBcel31]|uniref:hypothetical protein n=1 Tax=Herbivorax sp. ANBcel31 TaxID=3069754 RepID=UPI0027B66191
SWYYSAGAPELGDFTFTFFETKQRGFTENVVENHVDNIEAFEFGNAVATALLGAKGLKSVLNINKGSSGFQLNQTTTRFSLDGSVALANETVLIIPSELATTSVFFSSSVGSGTGGNQFDNNETKVKYKISEKVWKEVKKKKIKGLRGKFENAADKGIVGPRGQEGIKDIKGFKYKDISYDYEIKITGKGVGDFRIYGNENSDGVIEFIKFGTH